VEKLNKLKSAQTEKHILF